MRPFLRSICVHRCQPQQLTAKISGSFNVSGKSRGWGRPIFIALAFAWSSLSLPLIASPPQNIPAHWSWEIQQVGDRPSLRGVVAVNARTIWASGNKGTVVRSTDGGQTWLTVSPSDLSHLDFRDIHAWDDNQAVIMTAGQPAAFYSTKDGGQSWNKVYESPSADAFFDAMELDGGGNGLAFSDPIDGHLLLIKTRDRGQNWEVIPADKSPQVATGEAGFAASGTCLCLFGSQVWIGLGGLHAGKPANAIDGNSGDNNASTENRDPPAIPIVNGSAPHRARIWRGSLNSDTWTAVDTPFESTQSSGVFSVKFCTPQVGVAVGGDYQQPEQRSTVACFTRDGGQSWQTAVSMPGGFRSATAFTPYKGKRLWISVGPNGTDASDDDGEHWYPLSLEGFHALSISADGQLAVGVGADGRIGRVRPQ